MNRRKTQETTLAVGLAGVAGYLDALAYLKLNGLYVSLMSGNTTRLGVKAVQGSSGEAIKVAGAILAFVIGGATGAWVGRATRERRPLAILFAVAALLVAAGGLHAVALDYASGLVIAAAMGMQNDALEGRCGVEAVTYVTGALIKTARGVVGLFYGEAKAPVVQHALLWVGFAGGAALGAAAWSQSGFDGVWAAVAASLLLGGAAMRLSPQKA